MKLRSVDVLVLIAIGCMLTGCGDPGPASRSIALTNTPEGPVLVIIPCASSDETVSEVRIMAGADPWASADWVLGVDQTQQFEIHLRSSAELVTKGDKP